MSGVLSEPPVPDEQASSPAPEITIKLFPEDVVLLDERGHPFLLPVPRSWAARLFPALWLLLALGFVAALFTGSTLTLPLGLSTLCYPVVFLLLHHWLSPAEQRLAWFDAQGLHLLCGTEQAPCASYQHFIAFEDMVQIKTFNEYRNMGRSGIFHFRSYQIQLRAPLFERYSLRINTHRSEYSVLRMIKRVAQLPAAQHIEIVPMVRYGKFPPTRIEARRERARRLEGEV